MSNTFDLEQLERYLYGQLNAEESTLLERELEQNPELKTDLEILKLSSKGAEASGWKELIKATQKEYLQDRSESKTPFQVRTGKNITLWMSRIAASFALILVGAFAVLFLSTNPSSLESEFDLRYSTPVLRAGENSLSMMEQAYREGNYSEVLNLGENSAGLEPKGKFLLAMSSLELNQPENATSLLLEIEESNSKLNQNAFSDEIDYYLAKTYLDEGDFDNAQIRIEKILDDQQHTYHKNVSKLMLWKLKILKMKS
ncbi:hypothetical protein [Algoriphagus sp. CAU 1675]|uniref:hypothetical protein n=1 Tax=Algoriphagus sp. CAU 1675 TaxID=3032597 RepID=UPI0023DB7E72|nr:hypothetical protein [Algoriphagus sp. CAU 1675]MDF2159277.1 hypothetical protein [Algoriphagus sp. CAU 1675]